MRELTMQETNEVSGGFWAEIGTIIGGLTGGAIGATIGGALGRLFDTWQAVP